jgi:hypothetical protein
MREPAQLQQGAARAHVDGGYRWTATGGMTGPLPVDNYNQVRWRLALVRPAMSCALSPEEMDRITNALTAALPPGKRFALLVFDVGDDVMANYRSNVDRATLAEVLEKSLVQLRATTVTDDMN